MNLPEPAEIIDDLAFFDDWEERYQYIIDFGRELPSMDDALRTPERLVKGCQSNVWMEVKPDGDKLNFIVDSDAHIVRGLLAIVLAAFDDKTPQDILDFDIDDYFNQLDLESHLSPNRGNGLKAIVGKIRAIAQAADNG